MKTFKDQTSHLPADILQAQFPENSYSKLSERQDL